MLARDHSHSIWRSNVTRLMTTGALVLALVATIVMPALTTSAGPVPAGGRVPWQGGDWYLHGVNMPWFHWQRDFGGGPGNGGVTATSATIATGLVTLRDSSVTNVRWWVFPGDPWQIRRDATGAPVDLHPGVYADFDAALVLADTYDLYYDFVLFSGPAALPASWMTDGAQRARLATALTPLFARYKDHPRVMTWEVFNEPEWDIWNNKIAKEPVQATVKAIADAVHANSHAYVSVGAAMLDGLPMWTGLGLDYYRAHWYDYMSSGNWCARCTDYATVKARYNLDAPLVIGEFYAGPSVDALQRFEDFYAKGYAGAYAWSLFWDRTNDKMQVDLAAAKTFTGRHPDTGPRATTPPTATPTPTNTPTPVPPTATPSPTATMVTAVPAPSVSLPTSAVTTADITYTIQGTAQAGLLVQIWHDANANGALDAREKLVASHQLSSTEMTFAINVPLRRNAVNTFVATASGASGTRSLATQVPAITQGAARK